ncbi:bifunctional ADP-dependent (S)-NAD(P)H-hydrate dehydratase/NAD(P)H-hydrate epimerase [Labilibaculum filiforme]|uniref:Bifunctional NAD(P)H-hydrate repair enzyme n=1 Tax=Labilibaculum filiforme TaxID=1940526 RepID=A0A2N3I5A9_9BACT|nr:NAD(P)H-hydrate dehydratase [Labilibaculum filiforme]PKQ65500.1 bifunctional ADP-dependent (S)-NAD(P)H-hydrate dehydratase/NAD(P)H-hydrate epimerase [Labilibaculum filiforme]
MKIFSAKQIAKIDAYTIEHEPIMSIDLMERAASKIFKWIVSHFPAPQNCKIFVGPGNNGGDGLALARMLAVKNYAVEVHVLRITDKLSTDAAKNLERLNGLNTLDLYEMSSIESMPWLFKDDIVVDAIFGSGLSRPLEGLVLDVVKAMNASEANVIAIDIPSGLMTEDNSENSGRGIVRADYTLSFQFPKLAFLFPENAQYIGEWEVLSIGLHPEIISSETTPYRMLSKEFVKSLLMPRKKFDHKGTYGHGLLISGSYGKMGAAILASRASLRSGIGLLTTHIPRLGYQILQTAVPEAMVSIDRSDIIFTEYPDLSQFKAIAIGPGIDKKQNSFRAMIDLLKEVKVPMVIDADAINIIGEHPELKKELPLGSIFTPHVKEFERLVGKSDDSYTRNCMQREFAKNNEISLVLKGAYTAICCPEGSCYFNPKGNPGMATAGSGDVLTGIILSLLSQGYPSHVAAIIGVYLHGLAGDLASVDFGVEALTASDIVDYLPKAWLYLKK